MKTHSLKYTWSSLLLLAVLGIGISGCTDDDSFSASPNNMLTFSTDTVKLDTVFSRVPTVTRTFWVYNNSDDGIRCTNVRLQNGNQSGFRVNVDGSYLSETAGFQVNDVEIRKNDSICVFVELTSPAMRQESPKLVEDNLIFTLESGRQQMVNLNAYAWDATQIEKLEVHSDTTISSSTPIIIKGGIKVDSLATLTIAAGTTLYFSNSAGIDVYGTLKTEGTADKNVTLRGDRLDNMFDYLPYDLVPGQWQGIHFHSSSYGNEISFTDLHSAYNGIVCDSSDVSKLKLSLKNSIIHNCQGYGLMSTNSLVELLNTQITNTLNDCAAFFGGSVMMIHCTLAQFYPFDANRGAALRFTNYYNDSLCPLNSFEVYNSLVTGYAEDVVYGDFKDDTPADYHFYYSILRTVKPEDNDSSRFEHVVWEDVKDTLNYGEKHFKLVDLDNQHYDFHLDSVSAAIDAGAVLTNGYSNIDRDGYRRDDKPDIGCYEYRK